MGHTKLIDVSVWSLSKKVLFRFFFIYLLLQATPWLLSVFPGIRSSVKYYGELMDWLVKISNAKLFHVKDALVPRISNRDTSWAWAQQWLFLSITIIGCGIWSIWDYRRKNYKELNYWLCLFTRYGLAVIAFRYGIEKLFALQIPFPNQSLLSTPLGDLLPMRLYWVSMGYSSTYQVFAGSMEVLTGIFLIYKNTATLGALLGMAVFSNIMVMNFSYDIPVKILSINLVVFCLYLIANEHNRIVSFFILNKPAPVSHLYDFIYSKKWMRITRIILKVSFILVFAWSFFGLSKKYNAVKSGRKMTAIKPGVYNVLTYAVNSDTIPPTFTNSMRWHDIIFERSGTGSVKTADTSFRQLYSRGYFTFTTDTTNHIINFKKGERDSAMFNGVILSLHYKIPDNNTIQLWGKKENDSLYITLQRSDRHFPLTEKQFHWLTEYSR